MKQIMIFILPVKISIKIDKVVNSIVEQVNEILSKYADRNAEIVSFTPPMGSGVAPRVGVVIQYDA